MSLPPSQHRIILKALSSYCKSDSAPQEARDLLLQRQQDDFDPESRVLHLTFELGPTVLEEMRSVQRERAKLRKQQNKKRLNAGEGPPLVMRPFAATMNEYANLTVFQKSKMRDVLEVLVAEEIERSPNALMGMTEAQKKSRAKKVVASSKKSSKRPKRKRPQWIGGRRRAVVLTRYSCAPTDEPASIDVSGGKFILDTLVRAGVLHDDNVEWCARYAEWKHVPSNVNGWCEIDVYELREVK